jgi:hypothetical protein
MYIDVMCDLSLCDARPVRRGAHVMCYIMDVSAPEVSLWLVCGSNLNNLQPLWRPVLAKCRAGTI